ncbi:homeobox-domain-containing protein [Rhizodiscina lignyota]|uniref:Homeobox-domain-containing protein n=1 Tax=Rhizodiscina lignyota TaxID=1504668 RepID=A0A9P4IAD6_9PEZI|nr:homeobox-domain-containing protein [Rhizodiscina lignyota]
MVDQTQFIPLSPPSSPRMSGTDHPDWRDHQSKLDEIIADTSKNNMALVDSSMPGLALDMQRHPMLRSHKTFPNSLRSSGVPFQKPHTPDNSTGPSPNLQAENGGVANIGNVLATELPTVSFGGSAPASPISNLTPPSDKQEHPDESQDLNGLDVSADSAEEDEFGENGRPLTAAELRAQKRKMKRFRLTHNQTRFLMSEFARQAHPDAAHRERLSREIPGLSPRQVQVWFQNRRAKLKRLTSDDRERMMRSRALPEDFDMTQALHSPFGSAAHTMGTPLTSPNNYTHAFPEGNMIRPLNLEGLRRNSETAHMSPTGITPAFGSFNFTPPQSVAETLSPSSTHGESSAYNYTPVEHGSPRRNHPFGSFGSSSPYASHPHYPRLQLQDRLGRSRSESLSSPLRTSVSYAGRNPHSLSEETPLNSPSMSVAPLHASQRSDSNAVPYGLGYNYPSIPGFQAASRMRSYSAGIPRRIDLNGHTYRHSNPPQTATFPNYASSPLAPPHSYAPLMSAPHHVTSFQQSYLRPQTSWGHSRYEACGN